MQARFLRSLSQASPPPGITRYKGRNLFEGVCDNMNKLYAYFINNKTKQAAFLSL